MVTKGILTVCLFLLLATIQDASATIFKCHVDGKVIWQDIACQEDAIEKIVEVEVKNNPPATIENWESKLILSQKIAVGMSQKALLLSWGQPTEINRSAYGADQWIYRRGRVSAQYVYVENGFVTNWQN